MVNKSIQIGTKKTQEDFDAKIKALNLAKIEEETEKKAKDSNLTYIDLIKFPVSLDAIKLIDEEKSKSLKTVCFYYNGSEMRIGSTDPTNPEVIKLKDELVEKTHTENKLYIISNASFEKVFGLYKKIPKTIKSKYE